MNQIRRDSSGLGSFNIVDSYKRIIAADGTISNPVAAILALTELIENSKAETMSELPQELKNGAETLRQAFRMSIGVIAGCDLFIAFVTLFPHELSKFDDLKDELVKQGRAYALEAMSYRDKIAHLVLGFIKDGSVILTHSYSRVIMQALRFAHRHRRISVYVTEARPQGLGIKTYDELTAAGIPCTVILDSAVAYAMDKVDLVLVGSEVVVKSGGLVNAVGSNQMAIIAKAANKPMYALAESYKFYRHFPLSQYDLPTHAPETLSFPYQSRQPYEDNNVRPSVIRQLGEGATKSQDGQQIVPKPFKPGREHEMTAEQMGTNPEVDYTRPEYISLLFSDVGILTPEDVSQYLVGMFVD